MGRPPSKNKAKKQQSQPADSDNFISRKAGDLSAFITAIYTLPPAQKALRTKILSFNAWADWPSHSDVRNGLGAMALKTGMLCFPPVSIHQRTSRLTCLTFLPRSSEYQSPSRS